MRYILIGVPCIILLFIVYYIGFFVNTAWLYWVFIVPVTMMLTSILTALTIMYSINIK